MHNERHVRDSLERRRGELLQRRQRVALDLARANEPLSADSSDQAIQMENDQVLEAIGHAAVEEIRALEAALLRLEQGRYGICQYCSRPIEPRRLAVRPEAVSCIGCSR